MTSFPGGVGVFFSFFFGFVKPYFNMFNDFLTKESSVVRISQSTTKDPLRSSIMCFSGNDKYKGLSQKYAEIEPSPYVMTLYFFRTVSIVFFLLIVYLSKHIFYMFLRSFSNEFKSAYNFLVTCILYPK